MLPRRDEPFPVDACRDLVGLVRALYRATPREDRALRRRLVEMGRSLKIAIDLAERTSTGSVGHRAAWLRAEEVCRGLGEVVDVFTPARVLFDSATKAVVGGGISLKPKRTER